MDPSFISSTRRLAIFLSYSLVFSSPLFGKCYGAPENYTAATVNYHGDAGFYVVAVSSLLPKERCACNDTNMMMKGNDDELELVHTDNPCSKHGAGGDQQKAGATHQSIIASTFSRDQSRINWLLSAPNVGRTQLSSSYADRAFGVSQAAILPTIYWQPPTDSNLYVVKIGLGSPPQSLSVLFDTGSQILWTQCEPCFRHCYAQREHIFDPKTSKTYANFTCHSRACRELNASYAAGCFKSTTCTYGIGYGDGSYSGGFWAEETLTLTPSAVFENIRLGCGQLNNLAGNSTFAGILGLTRDSVSVVSQTADTYDQVFSYCIPSKPCFSGFLKFGRSCVTPATKFTPLKKKPPKYIANFYFIELTGIRVAGKKIRVNRSVLTTADTIIDSGTTLTYLPSMAYAALRASFREEMKGFPLLPSGATNNSSLDTCYDLSNRDTVRVPSISLFFAGSVELSIPPSGILLVASSDTGKKIGCLAFADKGNISLAIIGYTQQQTHAVVYDVRGGRIGFAPKGCH